MTLGYLANLLLGLCLLVVAVGFGMRLPARGRLAFGAFLLLVGASYALDATSRLFGIDTARKLALLASGFDPALLILFALAQSPEPRPRWPRAAVLLAPLVILAYSIASWDEYLARQFEFRALGAAVLVPYYLLAFVLVARWHHEGDAESAPFRRRLLVAMAIATLTRVPLAFVDVGIVDTPRTGLDTLLYLELTLLALGLGAGFAFVLTAPAALRASARRGAIQGLALIGIVAFVWLLRFAPALHEASFALLYSIRWFVFLGVAAYGARHGSLLDLPLHTRAALQMAFAALLAFLVFIESAALLAGSYGARPLVFLGAAIATAPFAVAAIAAALHPIRPRL